MDGTPYHHQHHPETYKPPLQTPLPLIAPNQYPVVDLQSHYAVPQLRPSLPVPPVYQPQYYPTLLSPTGRKPLPQIPSFGEPKQQPQSQPGPPPAFSSSTNPLLQRTSSMDKGKGKGKGPTELDTSIAEYDFEEFRFLTLVDEAFPLEETVRGVEEGGSLLPGYVIDREPDEREGLSKSTPITFDSAVENEKCRREIESIQQAQEDTIEQILVRDSKIEEARMESERNRAEAEQAWATQNCEVESVQRQAREDAVEKLVVEDSKMEEARVERERNRREEEALQYESREEKLDTARQVQGEMADRTVLADSKMEEARMESERNRAADAEDARSGQELDSADQQEAVLKKIIIEDSKMEEARLESERNRLEAREDEIGARAGGSLPSELDDHKRLERRELERIETPPPPMSPIRDEESADRRLDIFPLGDKAQDFTASGSPQPLSPPLSPAAYLFSVPEGEAVPSYEPSPSETNPQANFGGSNADLSLSNRPPQTHPSFHPYYSNDSHPMQHTSTPPFPPSSSSVARMYDPPPLNFDHNRISLQERTKHSSVSSTTSTNPANLNRGVSISSGFYAGGVTLALAKDGARFDSVGNLTQTDETPPARQPSPTDTLPGPRENPNWLPSPSSFSNPILNQGSREPSPLYQSYPGTQPRPHFSSAGAPRPSSSGAVSYGAPPPQGWAPPFLVPASSASFPVTAHGQRVAYWGPAPGTLPALNNPSPPSHHATPSPASGGNPGYFANRSTNRSVAFSPSQMGEPGRPSSAGPVSSPPERISSLVRTRTTVIQSPPLHAGYASYAIGGGDIQRASYDAYTPGTARPSSAMSAPAPSRSPNASRSSPAPTREENSSEDPTKHLWGWT